MIFDKKSYNKELIPILCSKLRLGVLLWTKLCRRSKKTVFIRNDKSNATIHQKWVTEKTKQHYKQIQQSVNPSDEKFKLFQSNFIESLNFGRNDYLTEDFADLSNDGEKWNF